MLLQLFAGEVVHEDAPGWAQQVFPGIGLHALAGSTQEVEYKQPFENALNNLPAPARIGNHNGDINQCSVGALVDVSKDF